MHMTSDAPQNRRLLNASAFLGTLLGWATVTSVSVARDWDSAWLWGLLLWHAVVLLALYWIRPPFLLAASQANDARSTAFAGFVIGVIAFGVTVGFHAVAEPYLSSRHAWVSVFLLGPGLACWGGTVAWVRKVVGPHPIENVPRYPSLRLRMIRWPIVGLLIYGLTLSVPGLVFLCWTLFLVAIAVGRTGSLRASREAVAIPWGLSIAWVSISLNRADHPAPDSWGHGRLLVECGFPWRGITRVSPKPPDDNPIANGFVTGYFDANIELLCFAVNLVGLVTVVSLLLATTRKPSSPWLVWIGVLAALVTTSWGFMFLDSHVAYRPH